MGVRKEWEGISRRLEEQAAAEVAAFADRALEHSAQFCESPIEAAFLAAIRLWPAMGLWVGGKTPWLHVSTYAEIPAKILGVLVVPQYKFEQYRIDFAFFLDCYGPRPILFVECDGHDFHERTPEQAQYDRARDRFVQQSDIRIFRFTGREIHHDIFRCVDEVYTFLSARIREAK